MNERVPAPAGLQDRRARTVERLCEHFAQDHLELAEFEARLDRAHSAATLADLDSLLSDLPATTTRTETPAKNTGLGVAAHLRATRFMLAFMGGVDHRGQWQPARRNIAVAVWGGAVLDFRDVDLPPGVTEISLFCCMGGAEIIVPPGMPVDCDGIAIMGGFDNEAGRAMGPDAPSLRVSGVCIMGGVEISVRHPGESARDARRRRKEEKQRQKQQRRLEGTDRE